MTGASSGTVPFRVLTAGSAWVHASTTGLESGGVAVERRLAVRSALAEDPSEANEKQRDAIDCVLTDDLEVVADMSDEYPVVFAAEQISETTLEGALELGAVEVVTRADCDRIPLLRNRLVRAARCAEEHRSTADSDAWYRSLLEHSSTVLVVLDEFDRRRYVSPAAEDVVGYEPNDLTGEALTSGVHQDDLDSVRDALERVRAEGDGAAATCEYRFRHADGSWRIHEAVVTDRRSDPVIGGIVASIRDVTDYHRVERELNEAFERVTDAFVSLDSEWRFSYVNDRAEEILGQDESALLGRTFLEVFPEAADTAFETESIAAMKSQEPRTMEAYYEPYDTWIGARIYPSQSGLSVYFRDVSERVEREQRFAERTERLETLVENVPIVLFALDTDGTFTLSEGSGLEPLGFEPGEGVGESVFEMFDERSEILDDVRRALDGELVHSTREYGGLVFETWYRPITRDGTLERVIGVSVDVTDRVQYEQTLNALHEATRHLLSVDSKQAACEYIVDVCADVLDLTGAVVYRFDEQENELVPAAYSADLPDSVGPPPRFRPNESITWQVFVDEEPALFADVRESEHLYNSDTAIRGGLYVPFGEHGVLAAISTEVGRYDETTFELAQLFGTTAEAALDRIGRSQRLSDRERELRRQNERLESLNRASRFREEIEALLLRADSRREIEQGVCDQLSELEECAFAWIGEPDPAGNQVLPQATAGAGHSYLETVTATVVDDPVAEPAGRSARTGQPTSERNVASSLRKGSWRGEALSRDFQSVYAVPLIHDGFLYGVLTVYSNHRHGFDEVFRSMLGELGETIAYTIQAVQRKNTLRSDERTEIELAVDDDSGLAALATHLETTVTLEGVILRTDESTVVFANVGSALEDDDLAGLDSSMNATVIAASEDRTIVQLQEERPFLGSVVDSNGGILRAFVVTDDEARAVIDVPRAVEIRELLSGITRRGLSVSLLAKREYSRDDTGDDVIGRPFEPTLLDELTDRQREVVQTAYHGGFFEWPRPTTGEEIAASLDISPPAFHNHVRAVERKLFQALFDNTQRVN